MHAHNSLGFYITPLAFSPRPTSLNPLFSLTPCANVKICNMQARSVSQTMTRSTISTHSLSKREGLLHASTVSESDDDSIHHFHPFLSKREGLLREVDYTVSVTCRRGQ